MEIFENGAWLPLVFATLMGVAMLVYAILDGYDIGVGILMGNAPDSDKDRMVASIGPFWDANETWLVLGVGLLLVAFPAAQGVILGHLYLPVALMLIGLILRGVSFDFRAKVKSGHKHLWNKAFTAGSLLMALSQGYMLGSYILGFQDSLSAVIFSLCVGIFLATGYCLIGAGWLIMKSEGGLQRKAIGWARTALQGTAMGIVLVSVATPMVSAQIFEKWFSVPSIFFMSLIPLLAAVLLIVIELILRRLPQPDDRFCWVPFAATVGVFVLCFVGLAYSFFPYIVPGQIKIVDAASAPESLMLMLVGALIVLPFLVAYTAFAYKVFFGKTRDLSYD